MGETPKAVPKKAGKGGLIALAVLIIILAVTTLLFYTSWQAQISSYQQYVSIHTYSNTEYQNLNTIYQNYVAGHTHSNSEYDAAVAVHLNEVNFKWDISEPILIGTYTLHVSGAVFNSGMNTATNAKMEIILYGSGQTVIASCTILLGDISGRSYVNFAQDIQYDRTHCASYSHTISYS